MNIEKKTYCGEERVAGKHVLSGGHRGRLASVETLGRFGGRVVNRHVESSSNSGALRIDDAITKEGGDSGIHSVTTFSHHISTTKF